MFCLLVLMCFGDEVDENQIKQVESIQRRLVLNFHGLKIISFWPRLGKIVFRKRLEAHLQILQAQRDVYIPLIRARRTAKQEMLLNKLSKDDEGSKAKEFTVSYADTLIDLRLPDENKKLDKKLDEGDIVSLCSEFLNAGTDATTTALQWIMANLVKHPHIQAKVFAELINGVVESKEEEIKEEDLQKMAYLKAVILEGLRLHPPVHFLLPHATAEDVLNGCVVPKNSTVNFLVAEMGRDPDVWEDPMEFKPERFINSGGKGFDITGSKEIKMMPIGAGRRICPAYALAMLHLEYFVANLVWHFEWRAVDGDDVDLSEKQEFTIVMNNPLRAHISPRSK